MRSIDREDLPLFFRDELERKAERAADRVEGGPRVEADEQRRAASEGVEENCGGRWESVFHTGVDTRRRETAGRGGGTSSN
jgi:hypothetical protein